MSAKHPRYIAAVEFSSCLTGDKESASCNKISFSTSASSYQISADSGSNVVDAPIGSKSDSISCSSYSSDGASKIVTAQYDHQGRLNQSEFAASCLSHFTRQRQEQHMKSSKTIVQKKHQRRQKHMETRKTQLMANYSHQKKQQRPRQEGRDDDVDRTAHNVGAWGEQLQTTIVELKDTDCQNRRPPCKRVIDKSRHNRTEATGVDERDRNGYGRKHPRCDLYLGLAVNYLVLMSSIAFSNNYSTTSSSVETAVLTLSSLSFIQTFILGIRCVYRSFRGYFTSKTLPSYRYNDSLFRKIQVGFTLEQFVASCILVNTCISSGMILYPRYDAITSAEVAVAGNDIWNANLFYSTYISLYGSAYLAVNVFVNDGASTSNQSSIKMLLFMALLSSICTATSLLVMSSGPVCNGADLGQMPYCSSAKTAGGLSVLCALFSSLPCVIYHFNQQPHSNVTIVAHGVCMECSTSKWWMINGRNSWGRRVSQRSMRLFQQSVLLGTSTLLVILQSANVAIVSPLSGPGHDVGNAFVTSWVAWVTSLLLWKNSCVEFAYLISSPSLLQAREKHFSSGINMVPTDDYAYVDIENDVQPEGPIDNDDAEGYRRAAAQGDDEGNSPRTTNDCSSYDSSSNANPRVVISSWNLYHDAKRKNVPEVDFRRSTSTQATQECSNLSLDYSSRSPAGTMRSDSISTKAGTSKSSSFESSSRRINKDDRKERPHGGEKSSSGVVSSKNSKETQSRRRSPPLLPPSPCRPNHGNNTSQSLRNMLEIKSRTNDNRMPAKGLSSTRFSAGSSLTPDTMHTSSTPITMHSSATPVTMHSSATPVTINPQGESCMASKRVAATANAAARRPLTPKEPSTPQKTASMSDESDNSLGKSFDILLSGTSSVVTELTFDEHIAPPPTGQGLKMTKLSIDVASAFHAAAVSANAKKTAMEEIANRFRLKPEDNKRKSAPRQKQSQSSSRHHPGSQGLPNPESLRNERIETLLRSTIRPAVTGSQADHRSTEAFLASSMREALMSMFSTEGCAPTTTDENFSYDRSRMRGNTDIRAKRSEDADAQRDMRPSAPIKRRVFSQEGITCESSPVEQNAF
ncbi:hypothetical protein ACHAW5_009378 [Stephanodiscus triporus]|uniref:Transmembrane protein n=1 Tax=Stephanodiscus triporus TaxID=2934178 RepID=A0ABD3NW78_9STRA